MGDHTREILATVIGPGTIHLLNIGRNQLPCSGSLATDFRLSVLMFEVNDNNNRGAVLKHDLHNDARLVAQTCLVRNVLEQAGHCRENVGSDHFGNNIRSPRRSFDHCTEVVVRCVLVGRHATRARIEAKGRYRHDERGAQCATTNDLHAMSAIHLFNCARRWRLPHNHRSGGSRLNTATATGACTNVVLLNLIVSDIENQVSPGPEEQIAYALKQVELGVAVGGVCRKLGIAEATFYVWRRKCGGLGPPELERLRLLEEENSKLKLLVASLSLNKACCRMWSQESSESCPEACLSGAVAGAIWQQ